MKMHLKKIVAFSMVLILTLVSFSNPIAHAKNMDKSILQLDKNNYKYIKGKLGDTNIIYTYTSDNKTFKVMENASKNFDIVDSTIYVENSNGQFFEYATQHLTTVDNIITITINENGLTSTDKIYIDQDKISNTKKLLSQYNNLNSQYQLCSNPTWDGMPVSAWNYYGEFTGSSNIKRYTSGAVIAILATIAASFFGIAGQCVVAGVAAVADIIVQDSISRIWYTDDVYYRTCIPPKKGQFAIKVAEYTHSYVFSSSKKTVSSLIGDYYYYYYDDLYVK